MHGCYLLSSSPTAGARRGMEPQQGIWYKEGWQEGPGCWEDSGDPRQTPGGRGAGPASLTLSLLFHRLRTRSGRRPTWRSPRAKPTPRGHPGEKFVPQHLL